MISSSFSIIFAVGISVMLLIMIVFAVTVYSVPDKITKEVSYLSCHDRILSYSQMGYYHDVKTVKAALDSCKGGSLGI
jgi:hypothetical protein